jgi:hypothetical protein
MNDGLMPKAPQRRLVERLRAGENFYAESSQWYDRKLAEAVDEAADEIERLTAELSVQRGLLWHPIATAPRDGVPVLLCTDGGIVFVGKLNKHLQLWVDGEGRERFRTVTYWMPLPLPPSVAGPVDTPAKPLSCFTEDQLRAAVAAERERCKDIVRRHMPAGWSAAYDAMADEGPN